MHAWLISHPITLAVSLFIAAIPFSLYSTEIKQFLKTPPQRLSVWILKARLSSAEYRLSELQLMHEDIRYFIYTCFISLGALGMGIFFAVFPIIPFPHSHSGWPDLICLYSSIVMSVAFFAYSVKVSVVVTDATMDIEGTLNALNEKIERLRGRLEEKGALATT
jgi:hypothetical protein